MSEHLINGKNVNVKSNNSVSVEYSKPDSVSKLRVSFYQTEESPHHCVDLTYFRILVEEITPVKLSQAQKMINKFRPGTYSDTRTERLDSDSKMVLESVRGAWSGNGDHGDDNFERNLSSVDSWYKGNFRPIVLDARELVFKGMKKEAEITEARAQAQQNQQIDTANRKMSEYVSLTNNRQVKIL